MKNIIIVDDEEDIFSLFKIKFRKEIKDEMYDFMFFSSGIEFLSFADQHTDFVFSHILIDLNMPEMGGFELIENINNRNVKSRMSIISGHDGNELREKAEKLGVSNFFTKPMDFNTIKSELIN